MPGEFVRSMAGECRRMGLGRLRLARLRLKHWNENNNSSHKN